MLTKIGVHYVNMDEVLVVRYHQHALKIHEKGGTERPRSHYTIVMKGGVHLGISKEDWETFARITHGEK